jgi:hypothetical protein
MCEFVDEFPDMYPEFAPEPIRIPCRKPGVYRLHYHGEDLLAWIDEENDEIYEDWTVELCTEHAQLLLGSPTDYPEPELVGIEIVA